MSGKPEHSPGTSTGRRGAWHGKLGNGRTEYGTWENEVWKLERVSHLVANERSEVATLATELRDVKLVALVTREWVDKLPGDRERERAEIGGGGREGRSNLAALPRGSVMPWY